MLAPAMRTAHIDPFNSPSQYVKLMQVLTLSCKPTEILRESNLFAVTQPERNRTET